MNSISKDTKLTIIYIVIAFVFSVLMRMIWVYQFEGYDAFKYAGQFMINTNDGYFWAEGARDILSGVSQPHDLSPITTAPAYLTAFFAKILPFSFESIIFYMPSYLSSLVVIPVILIAKRLGNLELGFISALFASVTWSYYNRTMVGYYDTDMLNIVLPMFLLWSIIWAMDTKEDKYLIITALDILVYRWWYPQSYSLEISFFVLILLYTLIFERKNLYNYKLLAIMMFAMMNISGFIRLPIVVLVYFVFKKDSFNRYVYYILIGSILGFFLSGGFAPIWGQLKGYVFKDAIKVTSDGLGLHYFSVMQTIREAGHIPFETFANRISGNIITFIVASMGYLYLVYKHRIMVFSLPMVGLGFLALVGGLRFTIYAVPIFALAIGFIIVELSSKMPTKILNYITMIALTLLVLFPNYKHIDSYKVPTVFNNGEVKILDILKSKADREDYAVAWWDYGYPIRYYSDVKTLADGGKHSGEVNFPVSFILTNPQDVAAKMARLDVEYTEKSYKISDKNKDLSKDKKVKLYSYIEEMAKDYGYKNTNKFLASLARDIKLPKKTRDIYLYLPFKMLNIYPTVKIFSNLDLMNGKRFASPFFYKSTNFRETKTKIDLGRGVVLNKKDLVLSIGNNKVPLHRFVKTGYSKNMKFIKQSTQVNPNSDINLIYMSSYNTFLVIDNKTYNSLYIQLMVLENYDKNLFEMVSSNPYAKLYKLKI